MQGFLFKNQTKAWFLSSVSAAHSILHLLLMMVFWQQTLMGASALQSNVAQGCIPDADPPHTQVTGAEGSHKLEGSPGSGCREPGMGSWGGRWAHRNQGSKPLAHPPLPQQTLLRKDKDKILKECKVTPDAGPSGCALCNYSGSLPKARAAGKQGPQVRYKFALLACSFDI